MLSTIIPLLLTAMLVFPLPEALPQEVAAGSAAKRFSVDRALVETLHKQLVTSGKSSSLTLQGYPLPDGRVATVRLQKFSLWAPDALIAVFNGKELLGEGQPRGILQLLGRVKEDPTATVQVRTTESGLTGFVVYKNLLYQQAFVEVDGTPYVTFEVKVESPVEAGEQPAVGLKNYLSTIATNVKRNEADLLSEYCCIGGPGGEDIQYVDLAVETDDELFQRFQALSRIQTEVEDIVAAVNTIYYREIELVIFRLRRLAMYTNHPMLPDPFYGMTTGGILRELRDFWNNPNRASQRQTFDVAVLLSGKDLGGSQIFPPWVCQGGSRDGQWCDVNNSAQWASCPGDGKCTWEGISVCAPHKAYAVIQHRQASPNSSMDAIAAREINTKRTAHELGHLFGAEHKYCIEEGGQFIDRCVSDALSLRLEQCYVGPPYQPYGGVNDIMGTCGPNLRLEFDPANRDLIRQGVADADCLTPARVVELANGRPVTGLSSTPNPTPLRQYFAIDVPANVNSLTIQTSGGTGALKLYARYGAPLGPFGNVVAANPGTTDQTIIQPSPRSGWWYILLTGGDPDASVPFQNVSLEASY
jgi:hypothetical protein